MKKIIVATVFSILSLQSVVQAQPQIPNTEILKALFAHLKSVPCNATTLKDCVQSFRSAHAPTRSDLTCATNDAGHGADVHLTCLYSVNFGSEPTLRIGFSGSVDAGGTSVQIDPKDIMYKIDPVRP